MATSTSGVTPDDNLPATTPTSVASFSHDILLNSVHPYEILDDAGAGTCEHAKYARMWAHRMVLGISGSETKCECDAEKAKKLDKAAHVLATAPLADVITASSNCNNVSTYIHV